VIRRVVFGIALGALLALPAASASAYTDTWSKLTDIPGSHGWAGAATLADGRIIVVAGGSTDVDIYSPAMGTWAPAAPLPLPRTGLAVVRLGALVYAIGGAGSSGTPRSGVWAYEPATDRWTVKANLPADRVFLAAVASGGRIYAIGGENDSLDPTTTVYRYTPSSDSWTSVAPLPGIRSRFSAAADSSGRIYVFGGCCNSTTGFETKSVYRYTPGSNSWAARAPLTGRNSEGHNTNTAATRGSDGSIHVLGGGNSKYPSISNRIYDPVGNTWHDGSTMPDAVEGPAAATGADGVIYALGGVNAGDGCGPGADQGACLHQTLAYH
jgi:N-acetylneuraminic acid mutarotase